MHCVLESTLLATSLGWAKNVHASEEAPDSRARVRPTEKTPHIIQAIIQMV